MMLAELERKTAALIADAMATRTASERGRRARPAKSDQ